MVRLTSTLSLLVLLAGCRHPSSPAEVMAARGYPDVPHMNARRWANGLEKAAKELGAAAGQVAHRQIDESRFSFSAGERQVEYALWCQGPGCVWLDDPRARAAFDLDCPKEKLQLTLIDSKTRGVAGCGRRATYVVQIVPGTYEARWIVNALSPW